ncbi:hypothetical protein B4168_2680 [Anoxybacillus flavithermus]|nr:hypothetical protein B4168_2680 [Anoxybacillus flavithermus]OAO87446.1 hypothetical protein GT23_1095 [Parageobacillus thermoglucosidasius]
MRERRQQRQDKLLRIKRVNAINETKSAIDTYERKETCYNESK